MSIMDMFRPAQPSKPAAQTSQQQQQPTAPEGGKQTSQQPAAANKNPNNPANDTESPLDTYKKLFDNASKNADIEAPSFAIDPKVIHDVAGKMDFTRDLSPELVQKATSGDAAAMIELIQGVGRNSYRAALEHTTTLTNTHLGQRGEFEAKRLQKGVKEQLTNDALSSGANFNHPVIKAELNRIARQFASSAEYADATPQEIANAAKKYLNDLHAAMNPADPNKDEKGQAKPQEVDYMKWLTE